jgi:hypothetical protein
MYFVAVPGRKTMSKLLAVVAAVAALALLGARAASADTHAPSTHRFTVTCGTTVYDVVVSPTDPARAAQIVTTTGVLVLAGPGVPASMIRICTLTSLDIGFSFELPLLAVPPSFNS